MPEKDLFRQWKIFYNIWGHPVSQYPYYRHNNYALILLNDMYLTKKKMINIDNTLVQVYKDIHTTELQIAFIKWSVFLTTAAIIFYIN